MKTVTRTMTPTIPHQQRGMTLLETLIAIVVMALAILGVLAMQMRVLSETQTSVRRAQSIRLIESLAEQVRLNPGSSSDAVAKAYVVDWNESAPSETCSAAGTAQPSCQLAKTAIANWKQTVRQTLPGGDVKVFFIADDGTGTKRQLGVVTAWRDGEKKVDDNQNSAANQELRRALFDDLGIKDAANKRVFCGYESEAEFKKKPPKNCHIQYIPLNTRCLPDLSGGPRQTRYYCAEGMYRLAAAPTP